MHAVVCLPALLRRRCRGRVGGRGTRVGLRFSLLAYSLFIMLLTAAVVHLPWSYTSSENIADLARQINGEIVKGLSDETDEIFRSAEAAQQALRDIVREGLVDLDDKAAREHLFFAFLQANPHFSWVSFGKPNGDLLGVQRRSGGLFRAEASRYDPQTKQATRQIDYFIDTGDTQRYYETKTETNDYYAPDRDWYKQALAADGPVWTDLYLFATSGTPGLNTAVKVARDGKLLGCLTIAIALERVSDYLRGISISRKGVVFIVDQKGRMIA